MICKKTDHTVLSILRHLRDEQETRRRQQWEAIEIEVETEMAAEHDQNGDDHRNHMLNQVNSQLAHVNQVSAAAYSNLQQQGFDLRNTFQKVVRGARQLTSVNNLIGLIERASSLNGCVFSCIVLVLFLVIIWIMSRSK